MSILQRGDVYLVSLNPTRGGETNKTRPCTIVSPDELNNALGTFLIAPMTTGGHEYPFRISCQFQEKQGYVVLDQIRAVDRRRLIRHLGLLDPETLDKVLGILREMFAN